MPPSGRGGRKLAKIRAEDNDEDTEDPLPLSAAEKKAAQVAAEKSAAAAPQVSVSPMAS